MNGDTEAKGGDPSGLLEPIGRSTAQDSLLASIQHTMGQRYCWGRSPPVEASAFTHKASVGAPKHLMLCQTLKINSGGWTLIPENFRWTS